MEPGGIPSVIAKFIGHLIFVGFSEVDAVSSTVPGGDIKNVYTQKFLDLLPECGKDGADVSSNGAVGTQSSAERTVGLGSSLVVLKRTSEGAVDLLDGVCEHHGAGARFLYLFDQLDGIGGCARVAEFHGVEHEW